MPRRAARSRDEAVTVWDLNAEREVVTFRERGHDVYAVAFSPDGRQIISAAYHTVGFWNLDTKR